jgi:hypothetical protein
MKYIKDINNNSNEENEKFTNTFLEELVKNTSLYESNIHSVFSPDNFQEAFAAMRSEMGKGKVLFDFSS